MILALGIILILIAVLFIAYFIMKPIETEKDKKHHKAAGIIGSTGLALLGLFLIFRKK